MNNSKCRTCFASISEKYRYCYTCNIKKKEELIKNKSVCSICESVVLYNRKYCNSCYKNIDPDFDFYGGYGHCSRLITNTGQCDCGSKLKEEYDKCNDFCSPDKYVYHQFKNHSLTNKHCEYVKSLKTQ